MLDKQLLKYGFVTYLNGEATYDHVVQARITYADSLFSELMKESYPVIARRCQVASEEGVTSPVFRYEGANNVSGTFQSAYYLADALTRKNILPVYFQDTGEVKNLMPLLAQEEKSDALAVIQILRARYIKPEIRHPQKAFLCVDRDDTNINQQMVEISDEEILKIFGRLPTSQENDSDSELSTDGAFTQSNEFISDNVARVAS